MKRLFLTTALLLVPALPAIAHPGAHGAEDERVKTIPEIAQDSITALIAKATLAPSWRSAKQAAPEARTVNGQRMWVVAFQNAAETDPAKRSFYLTLTEAGSVTAFGHTAPAN